MIARVGEAGEAPSGDGADATEADPRVPAAEAPAGLHPPPRPSPPPRARRGPRRRARRPGAPAGMEGSRRRRSPGGSPRRAGSSSAAISGLRARRADRQGGRRAGDRRGSPPALRAAAPDAPAEPTPGARERPETAKGQVSIEELTKLQQTVARRMAESKATAPHFYLQVEVDMSRCVDARAELSGPPPRATSVPSFNDMVVKAAAIALREHPRANGAYRDGRLELYERINVGRRRRRPRRAGRPDGVRRGPQGASRRSPRRPARSPNGSGTGP